MTCGVSSSDCREELRLLVIRKAVEGADRSLFGQRWALSLLLYDATLRDFFGGGDNFEGADAAAAELTANGGHDLASYAKSRQNSSTNGNGGVSPTKGRNVVVDGMDSLVHPILNCIHSVSRNNEYLETREASTESASAAAAAAAAAASVVPSSQPLASLSLGITPGMCQCGGERSHERNAKLLLYQCLHNRGVALLKLQQLYPARDSFAEAIRRSSGHTAIPSRECLGVCLLCTGGFREALIVFNGLRREERAEENASIGRPPLQASLSTGLRELCAALCLIHSRRLVEAEARIEAVDVHSIRRDVATQALFEDLRVRLQALISAERLRLLRLVSSPEGVNSGEKKFTPSMWPPAAFNNNKSSKVNTPQTTNRPAHQRQMSMSNANTGSAMTAAELMAAAAPKAAKAKTVREKLSSNLSVLSPGSLGNNSKMESEITGDGLSSTEVTCCTPPLRSSIELPKTPTSPSDKPPTSPSDEPPTSPSDEPNLSSIPSSPAALITSLDNSPISITVSTASARRVSLETIPEEAFLILSEDSEDDTIGSYASYLKKKNSRDIQSPASSLSVTVEQSVEHKATEHSETSIYLSVPEDDVDNNSPLGYPPLPYGVVSPFVAGRSFAGQLAVASIAPPPGNNTTESNSDMRELSFMSPYTSVMEPRQLLSPDQRTHMPHPPTVTSSNGSRYTPQNNILSKYSPSPSNIEIPSITSENSLLPSITTSDNSLLSPLPTENLDSSGGVWIPATTRANCAFYARQPTGNHVSQSIPPTSSKTELSDSGKQESKIVNRSLPSILNLSATMHPTQNEENSQVPSTSTKSAVAETGEDNTNTTTNSSAAFTPFARQAVASPLRIIDPSSKSITVSNSSDRREPSMELSLTPVAVSSSTIHSSVNNSWISSSVTTQEDIASPIPGSFRTTGGDTPFPLTPCADYRRQRRRSITTDSGILDPPMPTPLRRGSITTNTFHETLSDHSQRSESNQSLKADQSSTINQNESKLTEVPHSTPVLTAVHSLAILPSSSSKLSGYSNHESHLRGNNTTLPSITSQPTSSNCGATEIVNVGTLNDDTPGLSTKSDVNMSSNDDTINDTPQFSPRGISGMMKGTYTVNSQGAITGAINSTSVTLQTQSKLPRHESVTPETSKIVPQEVPPTEEFETTPAGAASPLIAASFKPSRALSSRVGNKQNNSPTPVSSSTASSRGRESPPPAPTAAMGRAEGSRQKTTPKTPVVPSPQVIVNSPYKAHPTEPPPSYNTVVSRTSIRSTSTVSTIATSVDQPSGTLSEVTPIRREQVPNVVPTATTEKMTRSASLASQHSSVTTTSSTLPPSATPNHTSQQSFSGSSTTSTTSSSQRSTAQRIATNRNVTDAPPTSHSTGPVRRTSTTASPVWRPGGSATTNNLWKPFGSNSPNGRRTGLVSTSPTPSPRNSNNRKGGSNQSPSTPYSGPGRRANNQKDAKPSDDIKKTDNIVDEESAAVKSANVVQGQTSWSPPTRNYTPDMNVDDSSDISSGTAIVAPSGHATKREGSSIANHVPGSSNLAWQLTPPPPYEAISPFDDTVSHSSQSAQERFAPEWDADGDLISLVSGMADPSVAPIPSPSSTKDAARTTRNGVSNSISLSTLQSPHPPAQYRYPQDTTVLLSPPPPGYPYQSHYVCTSSPYEVVGVTSPNGPSGPYLSPAEAYVAAQQVFAYNHYAAAHAVHAAAASSVYHQNGHQLPPYNSFQNVTAPTGNSSGLHSAEGSVYATPIWHGAESGNSTPEPSDFHFIRPSESGKTRPPTSNNPAGSIPSSSSSSTAVANTGTAARQTVPAHNGWSIPPHPQMQPQVYANFYGTPPPYYGHPNEYHNPDKPPQWKN